MGFVGGEVAYLLAQRCSVVACFIVCQHAGSVVLFVATVAKLKKKLKRVNKSLVCVLMFV